MITSNVIPEVGMGVTIQYGSDSEPATIIQVSQSGKRIVLQKDSYTRTDNNGMSESQTYDYQPDPQGTIHIATLRKDGRYRLIRSKVTVSVGNRRRYYDFSF